MSKFDEQALQVIMYVCLYGTWLGLVLSSLRDRAGCLLMLLFGWLAGLLVAAVVGFVVSLLMAFGLFWPVLSLLGVLFLLGLVTFLRSLAQARADTSSGPGRGTRAASPADLTRPALPAPQGTAPAAPPSTPPPTSSPTPREHPACEAPSLREFQRIVARFVEHHLQARDPGWGVALVGGRLHFVPTLGREPLVLAIEERAGEYRLRIHSPRGLRFRSGRAYRSVRKPWAGNRTPNPSELDTLEERILTIVDDAIERYQETAHKRPVGKYSLTDLLVAVWMFDLFRDREK